MSTRDEDDDAVQEVSEGVSGGDDMTDGLDTSDDLFGPVHDLSILDDIDLAPYLGVTRDLDDEDEAGDDTADAAGDDAAKDGSVAGADADDAPSDEPGTPAAGPVDATRSQLLHLRDLIASEPFVPTFSRALVGAPPQVRRLFPRDPAPVIRRFVQGMAHILEATEKSGGDPKKVQPTMAFLRQLGADHRKLRIGESEFESFYDVLLRTLKHIAGSEWNQPLEDKLSAAYGIISRSMMRGAREATGPESVGASVVDVIRPIRDVAIVRLITDEVLDYFPGQYVSALTPYAAAVWRPLSPTNPSNPARQIEFHVRAVPGGEFSSTLVRSARPGDRWVLAQPLGLLEIERREDPESDLHKDALIIAGGTGVTPALCMINDMLRHGDNPRVHLFYGARSPGELYALRTLVDLASTAPWLTIQPVAENPEDPWWQTPAPDLPRTLHRLKIGRLVDAVTEYGNWSDRQVLISGSPDMIDGTLEGLLEAGTPRESIRFDPPRR